MVFRFFFLSMFFRKLKKPTMFIICGPPGVGKSTTSRILAREIKGIVLTSEKIIKEFYGQTSNVCKDKDFVKEELVSGYKIMNMIAMRVLWCRKSIILDGVFRSNEQRDEAIKVANKFGIKSYIVRIICPSSLVKQRITVRLLSGKQPAGYKTHMYLKHLFEPINRRYVVVDSSLDVRNQIKRITKKLKL